MGIANIGQTVMLLPDEAGGHFNSHAILQRLGLQTIDMPIDYENLCVDREATLELVERKTPDFLFVDRSEGLRYEDFSFLGSLKGPVKIFDASQYLTQIITDRYDNPLGWGFDLMLFTLHKSFPGPQKAGIVGRENSELWKKLLAGLSTFVSSSHAENSYLFGLSLLRREWLDTYADRFLKTASELETRLEEGGVSLVPRRSQGLNTWPSTHHLWTRAESRDDAYLQYERLMNAGVLVNYRKLPYRLGYGLRLGTTHAAVAGIDPTCAGDLAEIIQTAIEGGSGAELRHRVRDLASAARDNAILPPSYWT
jgi:glycine hydroxymethyltransferase